MLLEADLAVASPERRASSEMLVLSRALCRYKLFRASKGLSSAQLARAARTFAQAHAPFEKSGALLMRTPIGVGVWWWDEARVAGACGGKTPRLIAPETVLRGGGDGWRVIACEEGYEAQYWDSGALVASSWRRSPFNSEQWTSFALGVEAPSASPPELAPAPVEARLSRGANWRRHQIKDPPTWREFETALTTVCFCGIALAAFFAAQALRYEAAAGADEKAAAVLDARMAQDPDLMRVRERTALLQEYQAATRSVDVLDAAAAGLAVLDQFGLAPETWSVDQTQLRMTVLGEAGAFPLREVIAAIESAPALCAAEPAFRDGVIDISASLACGTAP